MVEKRIFIITNWFLQKVFVFVVDVILGNCLLVDFYVLLSTNTIFIFSIVALSYMKREI